MKSKYLFLLYHFLYLLMLVPMLSACNDDETIDTSALTLVSYTPNAGNYIFNNDTIVLNFNKKVQQSENSAITINGKETRIIINGSTVYIHVAEPLANQVVIDIPQGALYDRSTLESFKGIQLSFFIQFQKQEVKVVDARGKGDYTRIQDAIRDVPSNNKAPYIIFVANGTYEELVDINKPYVHLVGQDWNQTIITYKTCRISAPSAQYPDAWDYSSRNPSNINNIPEGRDGATLITAKDFYAEDISFENKWGVDEQMGPQAEAVHTRADRIAFYHCKFRGFQDTWWTRNYTSGSSENINMRNYADNCWIEGGTDYVFGGGNLLVERSTLYNVDQQNFITAGSHMPGTQWGYVFRDCSIRGNNKAAAGSIYFGRAWQQSPITVFINTLCLLPVHEEGWYTMSALPKLYAEYNTTANGWEVDTSKRRTTYDVSANYSESGKQEYNVPYTGEVVLSKEKADLMNYEQIIKANDGWDPQQFYKKLASPKVTLDKGTLHWEDNKEAVCYLIFKNGNYLGKTTQTTFAVEEENATFEVKAVNRFGSLSK